MKTSVLRGAAAGVALATALAVAGCGGNLDQGDKGGTAGKFPAGPITMLVGQDAGGSTDLVGRALAEQASAHLGVPIIVQNRPGANGALAAKELDTGVPRQSCYDLALPKGLLELIAGSPPQRDVRPELIERAESAVEVERE